MKSLLRSLLTLALLLPITTFANPVNLENVELSNDKLAAELELIDVRSNFGTLCLTIKTLEKKVPSNQILLDNGALTEWDFIEFMNNLKVNKLGKEILAEETVKIKNEIKYFDALLAESAIAVELNKSVLQSNLKIAKLELKVIDLEIKLKEKLLARLSTIPLAVSKLTISQVAGDKSKFQVRYRFQLKKINKLTENL